MVDTVSATCAFCQIVAGTAGAHVVFQDEFALAFLDHRPLLPGHCLLVPRTHVATFVDLPSALIAPLFGAAQLLARAVEEGLAADGSFVAINIRISQSVPHLHIHVVPRWRTDGLFARGFIWKRQPYASDAAMAQVADSVRASVARLRSRSGW
jgi:histidine triad (HIT) family protein